MKNYGNICQGVVTFVCWIIITAHWIFLFSFTPITVTIEQEKDRETIKWKIKQKRLNPNKWNIISDCRNCEICQEENATHTHTNIIPVMLPLRHSQQQYTERDTLILYSQKEIKEMTTRGVSSIRAGD